MRHSSLERVAHEGNHGSHYNGGNLRNALPSQDRARSLNPQRLKLA
ncbi:MAG: hypothetical protein ACRC8K_04440 [Waterburya sp.]